LTNAQWHLALLACLVMVAEPSRGVGWRIFDRIALVLAGLTGPFCLVLAPIAVVVWSRRRDQRRLITAAILSFCAVMQTIVLLFNAGTRSRAELGASPALLIKILSRHVFLGPIEGMRHPLAGFMDQSLLLSAAVVVLGFSVVLVAFWIGPLELRAFLVFGLAIYASALARPQASDTAPQWEVLFHSDSNRYSLLPMLVFIAALVRLLGARVLPLKWAAAATLLACSVGIARDWRIQPYQDLHFPTHARAFSQAPPGTTVTIPTNPPGWKMQLVKH
jgi:hypothetical protein